MNTKKKEKSNQKTQTLDKDKILSTPARMVLYESLLQGMKLKDAAQKANMDYKYVRNMWTKSGIKDIVRREKAFIEEKTRKRLEVTAERITRERARIAFSNVTDYYDDQGNLIPLNQLNRDDSAAISSIKFDRKGNKIITLHDKQEALDKLSRQLDLYARGDDHSRQSIFDILAIVGVNVHLVDNNRNVLNNGQKAVDSKDIPPITGQ